MVRKAAAESTAKRRWEMFLSLGSAYINALCVRCKARGMKHSLLPKSWKVTEGLRGPVSFPPSPPCRSTEINAVTLTLSA